MKQTFFLESGWIQVFEKISGGSVKSGMDAQQTDVRLEIGLESPWVCIWYPQTLNVWCI